jgi:hypothetical protein
MSDHNTKNRAPMHGRSRGSSLGQFRLDRLWDADDQNWFHDHPRALARLRPVRASDLAHATSKGWDVKFLQPGPVLPTHVLIRLRKFRVHPWAVHFCRDHTRGVQLVPLSEWVRWVDALGSYEPVVDPVTAHAECHALGGGAPWSLDDREWFAANPGRTIRARRPYPGELEGTVEKAVALDRLSDARPNDRNVNPFAGPFPAGPVFTPWVVVRQFGPGFRIRRSLDASEDFVVSLTEKEWKAALDWGAAEQVMAAARTVSE